MSESVIYVADLAAYNAGYLRGIYVTPNEYDDADHMVIAIVSFITGPTERPAGPIMFDSEEWQVHDYIDGPLCHLSSQLGQTSDMGLVWDLAQLLDSDDNDFNPDAWIGWASNVHSGDLRAALDDRDGYAEAACGIFGSESDFAYDWAVGMGYDGDRGNEWPYPSVDWEQAWQTLDGFWSVKLPDLTYAIFKDV